MSKKTPAARMTPDVAKAFASFPAAAREKLMMLRALIFATAAETLGVGTLTETLKWGEPAYLTEASGSGSTVRLGWKAADPHRCAIYFNCQTTLVDTFRALFRDELIFAGNRAILLDLATPLPRKALSACLAMALTYHRRKGGR